jgi:ribosome-associated protein
LAGIKRGKPSPGRSPRIATSHASTKREKPRPRPRVAPSKHRPLEGIVPKTGPRTRKAKLPHTADDSPSVASDEARALAILVAVAAIEKKAIAVELLDVAGKVDYADFLVVMTGRSDRHVQALAQGIEDALRIKGKRPLSIEGIPSARWVLMDLGDVIVHVFQEEARGMYDLEGLWMDARRVVVPGPDTTE